MSHIAYSEECNREIFSEMDKFHRELSCFLYCMTEDVPEGDNDPSDDDFLSDSEQELYERLMRVSDAISECMRYYPQYDPRELFYGRY